MPSEFHAALKQELAAGLQELERAERRRSLAKVSGVNLCSNDYLGLASDARLHKAVCEAVQSARSVGGTGSRLLSGHSEVWSDVEEEFAQFAGTEAALYFGSGYAANLGLLTSLICKDDFVF